MSRKTTRGFAWLPVVLFTFVYHLDEECYRLHNSLVRHYMPCEHCAVRELTPHIGPEGGTTLAEDIESWVADVDELVGGD